VVAEEQAQTRRAFDDSERAHEETQKARRAADDLAKAERHRADEAERRFRRAKELGDLVLRITEEEIGADTPFQGPRRRLLAAALQNYSELLAGGHDDPRVRAELDTVASRVKTLLADQDLRREADGAFLLNFPDVRSELKLNADLTRRVEDAFHPSPPGKGPNPGKGRGPDGPHFPPGPSLDAKIELIKALTGPQRQRLRQISIQFRGPMVFNDSEVVEALNLSYPQRQHIKMILTEELGGFGPGRPGPKGPPGSDATARARAVERIVETLTADQRESWAALIGKPFNPTR
jgi:hypothetical protein